MSADPLPSDGVVIVIPSQGRRPELAALVDTLHRHGPPNWRIVVGASGPGADERVRTHLGQLVLQVDVLPVCLGYATARNDVVAATREQGARGYLFVDDDVALPATSIARLDTAVRTAGDEVFAGHVRRELAVVETLPRLVFPDRDTLAPPSSLPANLLYVPARHFEDGIEFPAALDFVGGEDTAFTTYLRRRGAVLSLRPEIEAAERVSLARCESHVLLSRVAANHAVLTLLRHPRPPHRWTSGSCVPGLSQLVAAALGLSRRLAARRPALAFHVARVTGHLMGALGCAVRVGDRAATVVRVRR